MSNPINICNGYSYLHMENFQVSLEEMNNASSTANRPLQNAWLVLISAILAVPGINVAGIYQIPA